MSRFVEKSTLLKSATRRRVYGRHRDAGFKQEDRRGGPRSRVLESHRDDNPGIQAGVAIPEKQMRVRFGGVTSGPLPWDRRDIGNSAKELLGIPTRTETHVMVDGRVLEAVRRTWEEREKSLEFR